MKTLLYEDTTTNELKTFEEVKASYVEENNSDLPIPDDDMQLIIMENLIQNGGNIRLIDDDILKWCNDYSEYNEADRYLSQAECDEGVKDIYETINCKGDYLENIIDNITEDTDEEQELLKRLRELIGLELKLND